MLIDPLNPDILESDIEELCSKFGEVKSVKLSKSKRIETKNQSYGKVEQFQQALVKFRRRAEAEKAVQKLNKRALDDTVMNVQLKK